MTRDESEPVRLVVADVDGTLVTPEKVLTPQARAAVRRVLDAGIHFTITSGPPRGMQMLIDDIQLEDPIIAFNGGLIIRPDLSIIRTRLVPREAVQSVIDTLSKGALDIWIYTASDWRIRSRDAHTWIAKNGPSGRFASCRTVASNRMSGRSKGSIAARIASGSWKRHAAAGAGWLGCIVLGRGSDEQAVVRWLTVAAGVDGFIGYAVGRTTWLNAVKAWRGHSISRDTAVARIEERFRKWAAIFEHVPVR